MTLPSADGFTWLDSGSVCPFGLRTCFASFANPWRSSRLSSSLPQSSQRTAAKNAKPNHAPSETGPLLLAGLNLTIDNWHSKIPLWFRKTYLTCWFARSARSHSRSRTKGRASSAESVTASILFGMTFPFCWWTRLSPSPPPEPRFETVATGTDPSVSHNDISCQRVVLDPRRLCVFDPPRVACNQNCRKGLLEITEFPIARHSEV